MARRSGPSLLMLYTIRCALFLAVAGAVALVLAVEAVVLAAEAAQPVGASAAASRGAPNRAAGRFLSMCISLTGFRIRRPGGAAAAHPRPGRWPCSRRTPQTRPRR